MNTVKLIAFETPMKIISMASVTGVKSHTPANVSEIGKIVSIGSTDYVVRRTKKSKEYRVYAAYVEINGNLYDCGNVLNCF